MTAAVPIVARPQPFSLLRVLFHPLLLAGSVLVLTAFLPWQEGVTAALAMIILLGVPHGALDSEIARAVLRPRFGLAWFAVFSLPYLCLFACVLVAWQLVPLWTLAAFLAASVWHFGAGDARPGEPVQALVLGGLPIALPLLLHPAATWFLFASIAGASIHSLPEWLHVTSLCWLALALPWAAWMILRGAWHRLATPAMLGCLFLALPPLTAFAIYFVCVHAPAHTRALIGNPHRAPRVRDNRSMILHALPVTGLTLLIGAGLWPLYHGEPAIRLLSVTLQMLAALTLPHMLLDAWMTRRERSRRPCVGTEGRFSKPGRLNETPTGHSSAKLPSRSGFRCRFRHPRPVDTDMIKLS